MDIIADLQKQITTHEVVQKLSTTVPSQVGAAELLDRISPYKRGEAELQLSFSEPMDTGSMEFSQLIDTPFRQTLVKVRASLVDVSLTKSHSPSYLAAKRRERSVKIVAAIGRLESKADKDDFVIWTHEPLSQLKRLLHFLDEAEEHSEEESEGNAAEILRQVRDSFLRGGWDRYRERKVRDGVIALLRPLTIEESISADLADQSMDKMLDLGLEPVVMESSWEADVETHEAAD